MIIALPREQEGIILIPMAKKEYLSPEMKEVKIEGSMAILAGSCAATSGVSSDKVDLQCDCDPVDAYCDLD